jgi:hypothetical protein
VAAEDRPAQGSLDALVDHAYDSERAYNGRDLGCAAEREALTAVHVSSVLRAAWSAMTNLAASIRGAARTIVVRTTQLLVRPRFSLNTVTPVRVRDLWLWLHGPFPAVGGLLVAVAFGYYTKETGYSLSTGPQMLAAYDHSGNNCTYSY